MISREEINKSLYASGGDLIRVDFDFYIATNLLSVWDCYEILRTKPTVHEIRDAYVAEFPKVCPDQWLNDIVQNNPFVILSTGATTPFGRYYRLGPAKNLEEAIKTIKEVSPKLVGDECYGTHQLFLGLLLKSPLKRKR